MNFTHQHFIPSYGSAHINCTLYPVPLFRKLPPLLHSPKESITRTLAPKKLLL